MRSVIAEYSSLEQARHALHDLELHGVAQHALIAEKRPHLWQRIVRRSRHVAPQAFVLVMRDEPAAIEVARAHLRSLELRRQTEPRGTSNEELSGDNLIDIVGADSFPASDPPCWVLGRDHSRVRRA